MDYSKHIILPDLHIPAHNKALIAATLKYVYLNRDEINSINFSGDTMDIRAINFYDEGNVVDINLGLEYNAGSEVLDLFDEAMNDQVETKRFLFGNHEDRLNRAMQQLEMSKYGSAIQDIDTGLKLHERGYEIFPDWKEDEIILGDLTIIHGIYHNIHAAYNHALKLGKNILFGHTHRVQYFNLGTSRFKGYNIGWMGDANHRFMKYMSKAQREAWQNAFAIVTVVNGKHHVQIIEWKDNHFVVDGKVYQ